MAKIKIKNLSGKTLGKKEMKKTKGGGGIIGGGSVIGAGKVQSNSRLFRGRGLAKVK